MPCKDDGVPGATSFLTRPGYAVVAVALAVLLIIGVVLSRQQRDTIDFFLAHRRVPGWAAA